MNEPSDLAAIFKLLSARIRALEADNVNLHAELDELRGLLADADYSYNGMD